MFSARTFAVKKKRLILNRHQKKRDFDPIFLLPILSVASKIIDAKEENQKVLPINTTIQPENNLSIKHFDNISRSLTDVNLSIKKIKAEFLEQKNQQQVSSNIVVNELEIENKYQDFIRKLPEEDHLKPILKSAKYQIQQQYISLCFFSLSEMRLVEKSKDKIVHFLRTQLNNSNIVLEIQQNLEQDQVPKINSFDLWRMILQENTEVKIFIDTFGLQNN